MQGVPQPWVKIVYGWQQHPPPVVLGYSPPLKSSRSSPPRSCPATRLLTTLPEKGGSSSPPCSAPPLTLPPEKGGSSPPCSATPPQRSRCCCGAWPFTPPAWLELGGTHRWGGTHALGTHAMPLFLSKILTAGPAQTYF